MGIGAEVSIPRKAGVTEIIVNADSEMILGLCIIEFIKHGFDHGRCKLLGRQAITAANHDWHCVEMTACTDVILGDGS